MPGDTNRMSERERLLQAVMVTCLEECERGRTPDLPALQARYPEFSGELAEFLANQAQFDRLAAPLRVVAEAAKAQAAVNLTVIDAGGAAAEVAPGDRVRYFGDYELLEEIARGGMGVVYKARQSSLNRIVAVKMILAGQLASDADVQRFRHEAEAAAHLDHPHIVPIYEIGEHEGHHYFSMKLIDGRSLRETLPELRHDRKSLQQGITLLAQVARAVHHAHQRGVLHRDLKPANILRDDKGIPYVTDFGLAKRVASGCDMTQTGAIVGTPSYMAPEQAQAQKGLTTAVDVYSLGAILYELLTGRPPFRSDSPLETLLQIQQQEPPRPSSINPRIDGDLETIALKCLEKPPARRYDSCAALADDLERWLDHKPIAARSVGRAERAWRWCQRNPIVAGLTAAVFVTLVGGAGGSWYFASVATQRADEAEQIADLARHRLYASTLAKVEGLCQRDPAAAVESLLNEQYCPPDLREFCWGHFYHRCTSQQRYTTTLSDSGWVHAIAVAPDRSYAAASADGVVLFDPATGTVQRKLLGGFGAGPLAISKNGQVLGAVSFAATTRPTTKFGEFESFATLFLWDTTTWGEPRTIERLGDDFISLALTSDGRRAATSSRNGTVKLWEVATGELAQTLDGPNAMAGSLAFSADDSLLAVSYGTENGTVQVWNVAESRVIATMATRNSGDETSIKFQSIGVPAPLAISSNGTLLTGNAFQNARLWQASTGEAGLLITVQGGFLKSVAFSPDQTLIATAGGVEDSNWGRVDSASGTSSALAQMQDGQLVGGHIKLWNATTGHAVRGFFRSAAEYFSDLAFVDDRHLLTATRTEGTVTCWGLEDQSPYTLITPKSHAHELAFAPDGKRLAIVSGKSIGSLEPEQLQYWDMESGKPLPSRSMLGVQTLAYSPTRDSLVVIGLIRDHDTAEQAAGWYLQFLNPSDASVFKQVPCLLPVNEFTRLKYSPDGRTLAVICQSTVNLLDAATGQDIGQLGFHQSDVLCIEFSPDGKALASGGGDESLTLWNVDARRQQRALSQVPSDRWSARPIWSVAYSNDGLLASGDDSGTVKLWKPVSGTLLHTIAAHRGPVRCVAFSPDSLTLATAGDDKLIHLWEPSTGELLTTLKGHASVIRSMAFSPDSSTLATSGDDHGVKLWRSTRFMTH